MHIVPFSEISGNRLDPDYSHTFYKKLRDAIRKSQFNVVLLKEITNGVFSGKTPASGDYAEEITPYPIIKVRSYSQESIDLQKTDYTNLPQVHRAQKGDIFILSAAHQPEYVGRHIKYLNEEPSIATSFVGELICVRANQQCESMYLFSLLSLDIFKTLINREKTGQTSHVYGKNIKFLEIPLPPNEKQKEIVNHIMTIRTQAKQLQSEAVQIVVDAKAEVERIILGE
jgi:restriction endonuclease S subunit